MIDLGSSVLNSLLGGVIMALTTSAHLYLQGKITGISGMLYKCIHRIDLSYNLALLIGILFTSSYVLTFQSPMKQTKKSRKFLETPSEYANDLSLLGFIIAGFLVGFGAKMGNGCTSGHGICGLPRFSRRSIVAIILFMVFGSGMATFRYYFPFLTSSSHVLSWNPYLLNVAVLLGSVAGLGYLLYQSYKTNKVDKLRDTAIAFAIGAFFSYGLIESGMVQRHVVVGFLTLGKVWNIRLAFVLGSAVGINILTFNAILKNVAKPAFKSKFDLPSNSKVDNKLVVGASIFGIGWGLAGVCPGPALIASYVYCPQALLLTAALGAGIYVESKYDEKITEFVNKNALLTSINKFNKKD